MLLTAAKVMGMAREKGQSWGTTALTHGKRTAQHKVFPVLREHKAGTAPVPSPGLHPLTAASLLSVETIQTGCQDFSPPSDRHSSVLCPLSIKEMAAYL